MLFEWPHAEINPRLPARLPHLLVILKAQGVLKLSVILQDRKHILKVPMKDSRRDAAALLHGLKILESNQDLAEKIADGGRRFVEEVLSSENVER